MIRMSAVSQLAEQLSKLQPPEREQLLELLRPAAVSSVVQQAGTLTPLIVSTPGVCGGAARIIRTRIPVWTLERMRQLGVSESDILRSYPTLKAVDLVQAWSYVELHRAEIEEQIRENEGE
jgi:uncharacterized protein (DUF433 family)